MASGSCWNLWVWLVGGECRWNLCVWLAGVVLRRYIDLLLLLIPLLLYVSVLFAAASLHFHFIKCLLLFVIYNTINTTKLIPELFIYYMVTKNRDAASKKNRYKRSRDK